MKTTKVTLAAALLCAGLAACGGPDLGSAESCARSYQTTRLEQRMASQEEGLAEMKWDIDCDEAQLAWYADKSAKEKEIKRARARYDFIVSNLSALKKFEIEITSVDEQKEGDKVVGKAVKMRIKGKDIKRKGDSDTEYELKDEDHTEVILCTQLEGKWKVKRAGRGAED